ncbi:superoxide dismutase family protein [Mycoplasmatota bacterium]|nr:superoxide dismutase family protein [Mycoplasmatota bacterium]
MENQFLPNVAVSKVKGGKQYPNIYGEVYFEDVPEGVMVYVYISGLPDYKPGNPQIGPHGFHIHEYEDCTEGEESSPFLAAGEHWNPTNQPHGNHPGDFPVLFSNNGVAYMSFFTNKFTVDQIISKSIIIHENPDDYQSQPAGNAGKRIACGIIKPMF